MYDAYKSSKLFDAVVDLNLEAEKLLQAIKSDNHERIYHQSWAVKNSLEIIGYKVTDVDEYQRQNSQTIYRESQRFSDTALYKTAPDSHCNAVLDVRTPREIDPETGEIKPALGVYVDPGTGAAIQPTIGVPDPTDQEVLDALDWIQRNGMWKTNPKKRKRKS